MESIYKSLEDTGLKLRVNNLIYNVSYYPDNDDWEEDETHPMVMLKAVDKKQKFVEFEEGILNINNPESNITTLVFIYNGEETNITNVCNKSIAISTLKNYDGEVHRFNESPEQVKELKLQFGEIKLGVLYSLINNRISIHDYTNFRGFYVYLTDTSRLEPSDNIVIKELGIVITDLDKRQKENIIVNELNELYDFAIKDYIPEEDSENEEYDNYVDKRGMVFEIKKDNRELKFDFNSEGLVIHDDYIMVSNKLIHNALSISELTMYKNSDKKELGEDLRFHEWKSCIETILYMPKLLDIEDNTIKFRNVTFRFNDDYIEIWVNNKNEKFVRSDIDWEF